VAATLAGTVCLGTLQSTSAAAAASACGSTTGTYFNKVMALHPLAYYRLDEPAGPTACDDSGNNNTGTYSSSGVTYGVKGALKGSTDTAVSSAGGIDPVAVASSKLPTGNATFTLEGWFTTTSGQDQMLVDMGQASGNGIVGLGLWNSDSQLKIDLYNDSTNTAFPISPNKHLDNGKWHFIAVTHSAKGKLVGYVDGMKVGAAKLPALSLQGGTLRIGWWVDTSFNQMWIGSMDEVALFSSALTSSQIAAQYAAGHS
jgi:hypothetical protein